MAVKAFLLFYFSFTQPVPFGFFILQGLAALVLYGLDLQCWQLAPSYSHCFSTLMKFLCVWVVTTQFPC